MDKIKSKKISTQNNNNNNNNDKSATDIDPDIAKIEAKIKSEYGKDPYKIFADKFEEWIKDPKNKKIVNDAVNEWKENSQANSITSSDKKMTKTNPPPQEYQMSQAEKDFLEAANKFHAESANKNPNKGGNNRGLPDKTSGESNSGNTLQEKIFKTFENMPKTIE
jgi:hypothetical protein